MIDEVREAVTGITNEIEEKPVVQVNGEEMVVEEKPKRTRGKARNKNIIFNRQTRLTHTKSEPTIRQLQRKAKRGELDFSLAIQRNEVWSNDQKTLLIHSILYGYPIPQVYAMADGTTYSFLDGKQRLTTILDYLEDGFPLGRKAMPILDEDGVPHKVAGKRFSKLPAEIQDLIYETNLTVVLLSNMTEQEIEEMFMRFNNGTPLSQMELTRSMYSKFFEQVNELSDNPFFVNIFQMSSKSRNRFVDQEAILQTLMLFENGLDGVSGFGSLQIRKFVMHKKENNQLLNEDSVKKFKEISDLLVEAFIEEEKDSSVVKALKKVNTPILYYVLFKQEKLPSAEIVNAFAKAFLVDTYNKSSDYGVACNSGSSRRDSIVTRCNEMERAFELFMTILKKQRKSIEKTKATFIKDWKIIVEQQIVANTDDEDEIVIEEYDIK